MKTTVYRRLQALTMSVLLLASASVASAQQKMPQTTRESIYGKESVTTQTLRGKVEYVEGNHLVVRMANGDIRDFDPPADRRFVIDGKELTVRDLIPGTKLTATVTTTTTPITDRTTTVGTAKVFWVGGTTVILTLPNNENRTYKVKGDYKFTVDGQPADVFALRKGMVVSAQKIVEEPRTEIASNTTVTGQAPPPRAPKAVVAQTPPPAPAFTPAPTPAPVRDPEPIQVAQARPAPTPLPSSGSQLPLTGALGLILTSVGLGLRGIVRARNR